MALLLIRANGSIGEALVKRLIAQGDQVRVIEPFPEVVDVWQQEGAYVVKGDPTDHSLVAQAAHGARTVVVMDDEAGDPRDIIASVIRGARQAKVDRLVLFGWNPAAPVVDAVTGSGQDHVVLLAGKRKLLGKSLREEVLAEAIDAADDIAGHPRLVLDLREPGAWATLNLTQPS
ncbi:MAG: NAD(P)H-binding protein [Actinomycetota bacterium]